MRDIDKFAGVYLIITATLATLAHYLHLAPDNVICVGWGILNFFILLVWWMDDVE